MIEHAQMNLDHTGCALHELTDAAIALLREHEPANGYYGCFSGGKDSCVIKELTRMAGVNATWHYNVTTIDPPELVQFIKDFHTDVIFERPMKDGVMLRFFDELPKRGFPTRKIRWCCEVFKERKTPKGSTLIFGVRAAESPRRANAWKEVTYHRRAESNVISPIYKWLDLDVWEFIRVHELPYCPLYDEGFKRLGCIGCSMASAKGRQRDFDRWPSFKAQYIDAFQRLWDSKPSDWKMKQRFSTAIEMFNWWSNEDSSIPEPCGEPKLF